MCAVTTTIPGRFSEDAPRGAVGAMGRPDASADDLWGD